MRSGSQPLDFVIKATSRCNLNCHYCYVYNKGDDSWSHRPVIMSDDVLAAVADRICGHIRLSGQRSVTVTFHGGEPFLIGPKRFDSWCRQLKEAIAEECDLKLVVQTNGTLINDNWCEVLLAHDVAVGVSVDGPPEVHDESRVDRRGRGSYEAVRRGIDRLTTAGLGVQILAVIPLGFDGLEVHEHLCGLQPSAVNYLLPDHTHETIGAVRARYGPTPCADFLIPIMNRWFYERWVEQKPTVMISLLWNIAVLVCGGQSELDLLGNLPLRFVFVETDGSIEGLDVLKSCGSAWPQTGLHVSRNDFREIADGPSIHRQVMFDGFPSPAACAGCPEHPTCAGGYLPHRYSESQQFDNPSVWCADILELFAHARRLLGVTPAETEALQVGRSTGPR